MLFDRLLPRHEALAIWHPNCLAQLRKVPHDIAICGAEPETIAQLQQDFRTIRTYLDVRSQRPQDPGFSGLYVDGQHFAPRLLGL